MTTATKPKLHKLAAQVYEMEVSGVAVRVCKQFEGGWVFSYQVESTTARKISDTYKSRINCVHGAMSSLRSDFVDVREYHEFMYA
tara:strand:- start:38068 stop:38322 length:255 start_codon:yes stop_codon:yes gene_type:complete